eukprot:gene41811-51034_t
MMLSQSMPLIVPGTAPGTSPSSPSSAVSPRNFGHTGNTNNTAGHRSNNSKHKKLAPLEDAPVAPLNPGMGTTRAITHKKELLEALRKSNPAGVTPAPVIFWDVEGGLKTSAIDDSDVKQQMNIVEN